MDQIPSKFLRDGAEVVALPLRNIINLSIKLPTFPEECKIAKLKPIFKKGGRTDPKNYRPISLLPLVSKIIEKSVHFQSEDYLNNNKIIYMYQSGFRANHSTDLCLAQLTNFALTGMEKQMHTSMILVYLQKAFDTSDYGVLLEIMKNFGFRTSVIKWFESYLSNRKFLICIDNVFSKAGTLYHKVLFLDRSSFYYMQMIFPNHCQTLAPICIQMTPVFSINRSTLEFCHYASGS